MLSKTNYCKGLQCPKMLWLYKNKADEAVEINKKRLEQGTFIHEVAKYLFKDHINIPYNDNLKEMVQNTYNTIESYKDIVITEASFIYENSFCSVDILKKNDDTYELYEVKSSTKVKQYYLHDVSFQYYILNKLGLNISKCYLVHINNNYIRNGSIEVEKLFSCEDVTNSVLDLQINIENNINSILKNFEQKNEPSIDIDEHCFNPYLCPFFNYCTKDLPNPNVFDIKGLSYKKKVNLYKNGKYKYEDLVNENIGKYKEQILAELSSSNNIINKNKIKEFLNTLRMPLYFLDFETYQMPIPLYDGISPYEQVPFQYSLHYLKDKKLYHQEFLAESGMDGRRLLAERLVKDIPIDSCILAYNMKFERDVIKKLASIYPDLSNHLMNIHANMKDLMVPFQEKSYYTKEMQGKYSIKYVLPALFPNDDSLNYSKLDLIHQGEEAMSAFANLENLSYEDREYTRERLLKYCELDTYAMVKIYEKLLEVTKE